MAFIPKPFGDGLKPGSWTGIAPRGIIGDSKFLGMASRRQLFTPGSALTTKNQFGNPRTSAPTVQARLDHQRVGIWHELREGSVHETSHSHY